MEHLTDHDEVHSVFNNLSGPIKLSNENKNIADDYDGELFNDSGFVLRAKAETGEDIHLWNFIYQQQGREIIVDGDVSQTLLVYGNYSDEEKQFIHPNMPAVNKGQNIEDYFKPGSIKVSESPEAAIWSIENLEHHCNPPEWHIKGERAGVKIDIKFTQTNPAFWHLGTFETLQPIGMAGYIVHCRASGTVEAHGKVMKFKDQFGVRERIIQKGKVPDRTGHMSGRGLHWMHGFSEDFSWFLMRGDVGKGMGTSMINIGGEQILLEDPTCSGVEEAAHWIDPVSKLQSPYKWRVWVRTKQGMLDARINAYGRQYYTWVRRGGTLVVNQYCADAEVDFRHADGRVTSAKQMVSIEHMRTFYRQLSSWEEKGGADHLYP